MNTEEQYQTNPSKNHDDDLCISNEAFSVQSINRLEKQNNEQIFVNNISLKKETTTKSTKQMTDVIDRSERINCDYHCIVFFLMKKTKEKGAEYHTTRERKR